MVSDRLTLLASSVAGAGWELVERALLLLGPRRFVLCRLADLQRQVLQQQQRQYLYFFTYK